MWRRCAPPPSTDAIRRRGHPIASSITGNARGWRLEVFGRAALTLKQGKLGLAVNKGQVVLVPMQHAVEPV